jgi:DNA adenine methylase
MVTYMCEICQKPFAQKGHLQDHRNRKRPCKADNTIDTLIDTKVKEALIKTKLSDSNNIASSADKMQAIIMDYSKKTREELIAICKEKSIKGYSGKKKNDILLLLSDNPLENNKLSSNPASLTKNPSPLRYPGGKTRAISILYEHMLINYPTRKTLLSPFFGGGSFELFLHANGYNVYGNDLFTPLYNFWLTKQQDCETLANLVKESIPVSKETFYDLRKTIMDEPDVLKMATSFFIINRTSFSGATLCGGFSQQASVSRLTESSIQRLSDCNVDSIVFSNIDCNDFLNNHQETDNTLVYADPPYYIRDSIYGKDGNMHETFNHVGFAETIRKRKDWMISYNDCEYIRNLYDGCRIIKANWSYGMNKSKASSEIIILPPVSYAAATSSPNHTETL